MRCILVIPPSLTHEDTDGELLLLQQCVGAPLIERVLRSFASVGLRQFQLVGPQSAERIFAFAKELAGRTDLEISTAGLSADDISIESNEPILFASAGTLVAPRIIRRLLAEFQRSRLMVTAVDYSTQMTRQLCCEDARTTVQAGFVTGFGEKAGNGLSIGVSIAPDSSCLAPQLADLETWSATGPVEIALGRGHVVEAVDILDLPWVTVCDQPTLRRSETVMMNSLRQSYDGWIATAIYRPISLRLSVRLAPLGMSPTVMNFAAFLSFAGAGALLATASYANHVLGALFIQVSAVLDGCDGEIARLRYVDSRRGGYLDQMLDRYGDVLVVAGISVSYLSQHPSSIGFVAAIWAGFTFAVSSYVTKEYQWFTDEVPPSQWLKNLRRRDLRNFLLGVSAVAGVAFWGMVVIACLSHISIFIMYRQAYRRI